MKITLILFTFLLTLPAYADIWKVDPQLSKITFSSIKQDQIPEIHHFKTFVGTLNTNKKSISAKTNFILEIPLASAETGIPISDERMQKLFFESSKFPKARLSAKIDPKRLPSKAGEIKTLSFATHLSLHGQKQGLTIPVQVTRINADTLMAVSLQPIFINVNTFKLGPGLDKLRNIAKLKSITPVAPVTFSLVLKKAGKAALK